MFSSLRCHLHKMIWIVCLALLLAGCGYHFSGGGENIDKAIERVYVMPFANKTTEANIENYFRSACIEQFIKGDRFKMVKSPEQADAVLRGTIKSLLTMPLSYTAGNQALENRMTVTLELVFEEQQSQRPIWVNRDFAFTGDYTLGSAALAASEATRKNALLKLASDTAERAYSMLMSGF